MLVRRANFGALSLESAVGAALDLLSGKQPNPAVTKDALSTVIRSVTYSTNFSPPVRYTGSELWEIAKSDSPPNPVLKYVNPNITLETVFGTFNLSPYGKNDSAHWKTNAASATLGVASVALLVGTLIFVWGRAVGRKGG